ncbi:PREDICTED: trichohyalin-like [Eufriesea mexicana]|uniref:trichohyalin-like n=1 Tax=Eufriesea mexicana TaxID=516756 RepID=UPI00083BBCA5|nr:PREDICTED: trichohyalin-like [Eufriesea mexicana]
MAGCGLPFQPDAPAHCFSRRMQPGVTVVLATVWLAACVVGTVSYHPSRLTLDQYSPLAPQPRQHEVYRRVEGQLDWKDQNPGENQPFDLSIGPRRSISTSATGLQGQSRGSKYEESDSLLRRSRNSVDDNFSPLVEDKQPRNFVGREFTDEKADSEDTKGLESASRELSPPSELEDPFVADDTFQDQGPGSVEIYKLDLLREKSLLSPTPVTRFPSKSKAPKKTNHVSWKFKPSDYKATSLKMLHKQSNSFDDSSTEVPPNTDPFSIGGVPELQVGCEGLEASDHGKERRSIDPPARDKNPKKVIPWADVTPVSLNLDYDLSGEEGFEEMDELLKLKKSQTTTERIKQNRGDMDATLYSNFHDDKRHEEKLPVRGDLGKSSARNRTTVLLAVHDNRKAGEDQPLHFYKRKPEDYDETRLDDDDVASRANQRRRILWLDDSNGIEQQGDEGRAKRDAWGFGEDEGAVNSGELQTRNQRRRLDYERWRQEQEQKRQQVDEQRRREDAQRRSLVENRTSSDIEKIRQEYEKSLELRQRQEEERLRRLQSSNRQQLDEYRRRSQGNESRMNRWQEEQRRRQELETSRKRYWTTLPTPTYETERERLRQQEEEARRREESRLREEENRRRLQEEEEERRRQQSRWVEETRRRQELDRRNLEERRRQWMLKQRQQEEEERRRRQQQNRNAPSNLSYPPRTSPNESRSHEAEIERERQRKLNEYMQRHVPINLNDSMTRRREEEAHRRKLEEERKLQEYLRRMQKPTESYDRNWLGYRGLDEARQYNRSRYPGPGNGRRNHGPSASTNIDPRSYVDEARRSIEQERMLERQRQQQEELRREALRREEEARRLQSRRYEEERRRQEAARLEAERLAKLHREEARRRSQDRRVRPLENTRPSYEDRSRFDEHRRPDTGLIPANLFLNESRRAKELERQRQEYDRQRQEHDRKIQEYERQRQEQQRRRIEAERRQQAYTRTQEAWKQGQRTRVMTEEERRREEARLNALSVKARIIVQPAVPNVISRMGFDSDIDFPGANMHRPGPIAANFPAPSTQKPKKSLPPCIWAVVHCCPSNINRLVNCFEAMGCPGVNWDPAPCRSSIVEAARKQVNKFYEEDEDEDY